MLSGLQIRAAHDLARVNEHYLRIGFAPSTTAHRVFVAELDGERVGLGRLVPFAESHVELGGISVVLHMRRRGVARAMVSALLIEAAAVPSVWCIPFADLEQFYRSFGLMPAPPPWPSYVTEKVGDCERRALPPASVLLLQR